MHKNTISTSNSQLPEMRVDRPLPGSRCNPSCPKLFLPVTRLDIISNPTNSCNSRYFFSVRIDYYYYYYYLTAIVLLMPESGDVLKTNMDNHDGQMVLGNKFNLNIYIDIIYLLYGTTALEEL